MVHMMVFSRNSVAIFFQRRIVIIIVQIFRLMQKR